MSGSRISYLWPLWGESCVSTLVFASAQEPRNPSGASWTRIHLWDFLLLLILSSLFYFTASLLSPMAPPHHFHLSLFPFLLRDRVAQDSLELAVQPKWPYTLVLPSPPPQGLVSLLTLSLSNFCLRKEICGSLVGGPIGRLPNEIECCVSAAFLDCLLFSELEPLAVVSLCGKDYWYAWDLKWAFDG